MIETGTSLKPNAIRRIGELIAIAVMCYRQLSPEEFAGRSQLPSDSHQDGKGKLNPGNFVSGESERQILRYLAVVGSAAPKDFQVVLGLSHTTVTRKLVGLRASNLVTVSGKTKAVRYALVQPTTP